MTMYCEVMSFDRNAYYRTPEQRAKRRGRMQVLRARTREKYNAYHREWYRANRGRLLARARAKDYGLTEEAYLALPGAAANACAICGRGQTRSSRDGFVAALNVDHHHASGRVRGLLCDACNSLLARAGDDVERLRAAIAYLEAAL